MSLAARLAVGTVAAFSLGVSLGLFAGGARPELWSMWALTGCVLALVSIPRRL